MFDTLLDSEDEIAPTVLDSDSEIADDHDCNLGKADDHDDHDDHDHDSEIADDHGHGHGHDHDPDSEIADGHIPHSVRPYLSWTNVRARVEACLPISHADHRIEFKLAPPGDSSPLVWISNVLKCGLSAATGIDVCFKIGITYWPSRRFEMQDYRRLPLMIVALISEQCDWVAAQETAALANYRVRDRKGRVVNERGDARCLNRAPGGESHGHGYSPHFLYLVFGGRTCFQH